MFAQEAVDNTRKNGPHRIASLDGCRAISILLVALAHLCETPAFQAFNPYARFMYHFGPYGVEVFFRNLRLHHHDSSAQRGAQEWQSFYQKFLYPARLQNLAGRLCLFTRCGCSRMESCDLRGPASLLLCRHVPNESCSGDELVYGALLVVGN